MSESVNQITKMSRDMTARHRLQTAFVLVFVFLLPGCGPALQPDNYADRIAVRELGDDRFAIDYRGADRGERAIDLVLLRSAEVALQNGFNYFIVIDAEGTDDGQQFNLYEDETYRLASPGLRNTIVCFQKQPSAFAYVALFVKASLRNRYGLDQAGAAG